MTAIDPLTTPDALSLLAAIDAGDCSALPILADALEEAGDARTAGLLRLVGAREPFSVGVGRGPEPYAWYEGRDDLADRQPSYYLPCLLFRQLPPSECQLGPGAEGRYYRTRSAAFLALALALEEVEGDEA